ncbi:adult cuticle protein 1-like [Contarinia nasturtii]|uniref:adult cuticle protein 1-like n=1 Tax=Contarinia nasturtii TaxID=265458 RepID=UPI0012D4C2E3|nr:adult cuticle protein 1-like [Contarinia nasturtii]
MKFIISVVILALAVYSDAGFLPPAVIDISAGPWNHYGSYGLPAALPYLGLPAAPAYHGYPYFGPGPTLTTSGPWGHSAAWGPTTAYQVNPLASAHDGKYVAANRGSVHVAPLVGHTQSVSSSNLQPAPGTTY